MLNIAKILPSEGKFYKLIEQLSADMSYEPPPEELLVRLPSHIVDWLRQRLTAQSWDLTHEHVKVVRGRWSSGIRVLPPLLSFVAESFVGLCPFLRTFFVSPLRRRLFFTVE